jgi:histidine triad (HIT) family protein
MPGDIVFETDDVMAFLDIRPLFPGHTLLVPKIHHETIWDIPSSLHAKLFDATRILSIAVKNALNADGIFVANNNIVSQSVAHFHMHVIPRRKGDGLKGFFWPRITYANDEHKMKIKAQIIERVANVR